MRSFIEVDCRMLKHIWEDLNEIAESFDDLTSRYTSTPIYEELIKHKHRIYEALESLPTCLKRKRHNML